MDVKEQFLDAMCLLVDDSVKKAQYDKTIQAQILSCEDATIGKYRCRYQDAIIYAYSNNSDTTFSDGAYVYILVPNGDMGKEKTILGTTKKLGINYISQAQGDEAYNIIGNNCIKINVNNIYYLDTNNKNYKYKIYEAKNDEDQDQFFDTTALEQYIKESSSVIVGGIIKTSISPEKQYQGHYGITYNLRFHDSVNNTEVIRSYTIDEDNMVDNPYRLVYGTRQYQIFEIDGPNFIRVQSIQIFNKNFPGAEENITSGLLNTGDIEISNLELSGAIRMSESEINGVAITFYTPQGTFFTKNSAGQSRIITAQVRVKGKLASAAQNIPFYWGSENVGVSASSPYYNKYLGRGWKCLNDNNIIQQQMQHIDSKFANNTWIIENKQENKYYFRGFEVYIYNSQEDSYRLKTPEDEILGNEQNFYYSKPNMVEWIPGTDTYILKFEDATAHDNKFKVAIIYDGVVVTKTINIQNLAGSSKLTIESNGGTQFYYDIGHPTLTCKVFSNDDIEQDSEGYIYNWAYEDNSGIFNELIETTELNDQYNELVKKLKQLQSDIATGIEFENSVQEAKNNLQSSIKGFDLIQRVENNKIHNVQIRNITSFGTFKCSVYNKQNETYLGTTSITLTNTLEGEDLYSVVINNGAATFQYNENGIAPNNKSLIDQQQIKSLTFTVYDNLGQPIDEDIIANDKNCKIRWYFPIKDTLLDDKQDDEENNGIDPTLTYRYYDNKTIILYDIAQKYDIKKQNNQIRLTVDYKGMNLTTQTQFNFIKQGEPGTNGTEYVVKLVPNTLMNNPPIWPMITKVATGNYILNYGLGSLNQTTEIGIDNNNNEGYKFFKAQLWHNGELIWQGNELDSDDYAGKPKPDYIYWQILSNKYDKDHSDTSNFIIKNNLTGRIGISSNGWDQDNINVSTADIIKCSIRWQGKLYYGTIPITTAWVDSEKYKINLKDYTGWRYAIYTNDGVSPQYDNSHPFEFICMQKISYEPNDYHDEAGEKWEDVSLVPLEEPQNGEINKHEVLYEINSISSYYGTGPQIAIDDNGNFIRDNKGNFVYKKDNKGNIIYNKEYIYNNLIEVLNQQFYIKNCQKNQRNARPASRYDGLCVNAAITCKYLQVTGTQNVNDKIEKTTKVIGTIKVPIHFLLNKFGLSYINEWDGNSIQIKKEEGYILSPQMGAGSKNQNNQFTGVLMGEVTNVNKDKPNIGLLGYLNGDRTFFLNSQNGSALLGRANKSQITIDPSSDRAMIYSGNFWKDYDKDTGLPNGYGYRNFPSDEDKKKEDFNPTDPVYFKPNGSNANQQGLLIDLTTPEIYFGSGSFYVNSNGHIHAAGGGDIGGWLINDYSIYSNISQNNGRITLEAGTYDKETNKVKGPGKFYSHSHSTLNTADKGFYLSYDGLSIGSKVKIDSADGIMYLGKGAVDNSSTKHWTINSRDTSNGGESYIAYGGTTLATLSNDNSEAKNEAARIYIGTDGISFGRRFSITPQGELTAYRGTIGGWTINSTTLSAKNILLKSSGTIETSDFKSGSTGWQITSGGNAEFNNLTANKSGYIAGWEITNRDNYKILKAGNLILNSNGTITGDGWTIDKNSFNIGNNGSIVNININGGGSLGTGAGSIGNSSGYLGGGSSSSAPLTWSNRGVTLNKGVKIGNMTINDQGGLWYGGTNKTIIGETTIFSPTISGSEVKVDDITFDTKGGQLSVGGTKTKTGKAIFSDGSSLTFSHGLCVGYDIKNPG